MISFFTVHYFWAYLLNWIHFSKNFDYSVFSNLVKFIIIFIHKKLTCEFLATFLKICIDSSCQHQSELAYIIVKSDFPKETSSFTY